MEIDDEMREMLRSACEHTPTARLIAVNAVFNTFWAAIRDIRENTGIFEQFVESRPELGMTGEDVRKVTKQLEAYISRKLTPSFDGLKPMLRRINDESVDISALATVQEFSKREWYDWLVEDEVSVQVIAACAGVREEQVFSILRHISKGVARAYFSEREKSLERLRLVAWQQDQKEQATKNKRQQARNAVLSHHAEYNEIRDRCVAEWLMLPELERRERGRKRKFADDSHSSLLDGKYKDSPADAPARDTIYKNWLGTYLKSYLEQRATS